MKLEWVKHKEEERKKLEELEVNKSQEAISRFHDLFLNEEELVKYQKLVTEKEITEEHLDILIESSRAILKNLWIKQRFPAYLSKQWDYLSILIHSEWGNLLFLNEIKEGKRPLQNIIHAFSYN